jgi:predicted AlkP superfamily phosphohydrolase/phosphomutase
LADIVSATNRFSLPHFRTLLGKGSSANLQSVYPYVTAPAWTSIFTGVNPGKHGIFDMFDTSGGSFSPSNMRNSDLPFLWDYVTWAGKTVLALGVPFVYPAPKVEGVFVTGRFSPKLSVYPEYTANTYDLSGFEYEDLPTEEGIENIMRNGAETMSQHILAGLAKRIDSSLALLDSRDWDLVIFVDSLPDEIFHIAYENETVLRRMFLALDGWLGKILERLDEHDHLIVVSDHGFSRIEGVFFINEWLRSKNYVEYDRGVLTRIASSLGIGWELVSKPGPANDLYRLALRRFPRALQAAKGFVREGLIHDAGEDANSKVSAFGINEQVSWIRVRSEKWDEGAPASNIMYAEIEGLKRMGLLKNVFRTKDVYNGKTSSIVMVFV